MRELRRDDPALIDMEDHRLQSIEFIGVQQIGKFEFAMFNDPVTGTTFCVRPGETLGQAVHRVSERYAEDSEPGGE